MRQIPAVAMCLAIVWSGSTRCALAGTVGYAAGHPEDAKRERFTSFLSYLEDQTREKQNLVVDTYEKIRVRLLKGELDLAIISSLNYVLIKRADAENKVRLIARIEKYESSHYQSSLIVNRNFVGSGRDLGSLTLLFPSEASTSGYLYPLSMARELGVDDVPRELEPGGKYKILERVASDENVYGGASDSTFEAARTQGILVSRLFKLKTSATEIPYDALVVYRGPRQSAYERAISPFFIQESTDDVRSHMPRIAGITGFLPASDVDYDPVRRRLAVVNGGRVLRVGLSKALEPVTDHGKQANFRPLQLHLFNKFNMFLQLRIDDAEATQNLLDDLENDYIDLAELPPVPTGRAISAGLKPILIPVYDDRYYSGIMIRRKGDPLIQSSSDLHGKKVALGSSQSASGYVYPLQYLEKQQQISRTDVIIKEGLSADEIITAVARNEADAGALARFRFEAAQNNGHTFVDRVEPIPDFDVRIPNGGYVLNRSLSNNKDEMTIIRDNLSEASTVLAAQLRPRLEVIRPDERNSMLEHFSWANPKDRRPLVLLLVAAVIVAAVVVVFLHRYRPTDTN